MSADMKSQDSDHDSEYESDNLDDDEDDCGYYYNDTDDLDIDKPKKTDDPEYFEYELLQIEDVERLMNEEVEALCSSQKIVPSLAKMLLQGHMWDREYVTARHTSDPAKLLVDSKIMAASKFQQPVVGITSTCPVCLQTFPVSHFHSLACNHMFCFHCWDCYFQVQIGQGLTTNIQCMGKDCDILVPEDFLCKLISSPESREKYSRLLFIAHIDSHPELRFCPGPNCSVIIRAKDGKAKKVECSHCKTSFCFKCGIEYHAPTGCETIKKWLTKCADDSETANYISAHTKDVCIFDRCLYRIFSPT
ncbi:hypothetical protein ScPMuIL_008476 [Solemya velum]